MSSEKENWLECLETENVRLDEFDRRAVDLDETAASLAVSHRDGVLLPTEALNLFHFALSAAAEKVIAARVMVSEGFQTHSLTSIYTHNIDRLLKYPCLMNKLNIYCFIPNLFKLGFNLIFRLI